MWKQLLIASTLAGGLGLAGTSVLAEEAPVQKQAQEQIYGSQLMTAQERKAYRAKMRTARTAEERERIREEHHKAMQVRAREKGLELPDSPPPRGSGGGMGPGGGAGQGSGTGMGGGMGQGGGGMGPRGGAGR